MVAPPQGAVNKGECKWTALMREAKEELGVRVDPTKGGAYLGGWQQGRARDNSINDNFSAFAVWLESEHYQPDNDEISRATFFTWRPMLEAWRQQQKPDKFVWMAPDTSATERVANKTLQWLDNYDQGRYLKCRITSQKQGEIDASKIVIG